ncbi:MAG: sulfite exporter TauE/SafE family protein [Bacteroidota bacterium]
MNLLVESYNMKEFAACAASLTIGLSLGLIGAGGSILTIPVFVYILEKDPVSSSIYSMFIVGLSSMIGSIKSMISGLIDFKVAILFGIPSVIGVLIARKLLFPSIPMQLASIGSFVLSKEILLMLCLSVLMFLAGIKMLRSPNYNEPAIGTGKVVNTGLLLTRGLLVGIITGLLGIGGGFLIVPALYLYSKLPMKMAIGTALLLITLNSLISFLTSYTSIPIDWVLLIKFSLGSILGILIGTKLSEKISGNYLKKMIGWFVLTISFYIVYKQFFL